ncbi:hypothetical protein MTO96_051397 [Rhipicephalus appendiculatus]
MAENQEQPQVSAMLATAVDGLCDAFLSLPFEELRALDSHFQWLAPLSGDTLSQAVDSIRHSLMAVQSEKECLKCIATLYAWLIPRRVHHPWYLYYLSISPTTMDNIAFGEALVNVLRFAGWIETDATVNCGTATCVTVVVNDKRCYPPQYKPVCFAIWPALPVVAIHAPGMTFGAPPDLPSPYWANRASGPFSNLELAHVKATAEAGLLM